MQHRHNVQADSHTALATSADDAMHDRCISGSLSASIWSAYRIIVMQGHDWRVEAESRHVHRGPTLHGPERFTSLHFNPILLHFSHSSSMSVCW